MKALIVALYLLVAAQIATACALWRGQVSIFQADGTSLVMDNKVLYAYDVSQPIKTFTYGSFDTRYVQYGEFVAGFDVVPVSVIMDESVGGYGWFSAEADPTRTVCQFSLAYQADAVMP